MTEAIPPVTAPRRTSPGLGQSIGLLVVFYVFIAVASFAVSAINAAAGIRLDLFSSLLIMQAVAWPITIGLGLQWARVPFRVAYPFRPFRPRIIPALLVAFFGLAILSTSLASAIPMPESLRQSVSQAMEGGTWPTRLLAAVVIAPLTEEMFFRGLTLRGFLGRYSRTTAVWASSLIFALFHLNPWQAAVALPTGLALAWLFLRTGSLLPCILGHATVNFSVQLVTPLGRVLGYDAEALQAMEYYPPPILAIGVAATLLGGIVLRRQLASPSPPEPPVEALPVGDRSSLRPGSEPVIPTRPEA